MKPYEHKLYPSKFLSDDEMIHLREVLKRFKHKEFRNYLMFEFLIHTGCRLSEMLFVTKEDLLVERRGVFITALKGSVSRVIPLPDEFLAELLIYTQDLGPKDRIFPLSRHTVQGLWNNFRPVKKAMRSLRHSFGVRTYRKTRDIHLTQKAMGHKSINNTMIYLDFVYEDEEFRRILI